MRARDEVLHTGEERIEANGIEIVYDTFGSPTDPPILLIMGLGAQMIAWHDDFCARLAGRGHYVVRYDNRDVGLSTKMSGMPNVLEMVQAWLGGESPEVEVPYTLADMAEQARFDAGSVDFRHVFQVAEGLGPWSTPKAR